MFKNLLKSIIKNIRKWNKISKKLRKKNVKK